MSNRERSVRVFVWLWGFILMMGLPAWAQDAFPRGEVFGGYSYASTAFGGTSRNSNGWGAGLSANFSEHFGFTADFGGHYAHLTYNYYPPTLRVSFNTYEYLFGPRFTVRNERLTAFAHALFGVVNRRIGGYTIGYPSFYIFPGISQNNFAMGFGGGMDVNTSKNVAIRLLQFDYIPVREPSYGYIGGYSGWSHDVRLKTGVVFKF